jgi:predicted esterase
MRYHKPLKGVVCISGYVPLIDEYTTFANNSSKLDEQNDTALRTPISKANVNISIYAAHGKSDEAIPFAFSGNRFQKFRKAMKGVVFQGRTDFHMAHFVPTHILLDMLNWIQTKHK